MYFLLLLLLLIMFLFLLSLYRLILSITRNILSPKCAVQYLAYLIGIGEVKKRQNCRALLISSGCKSNSASNLAQFFTT